jgi:hypothetical protein
MRIFITFDSFFKQWVSETTRTKTEKIILISANKVL